jgi:hypothetical protein
MEWDQDRNFRKKTWVWHLQMEKYFHEIEQKEWNEEKIYEERGHW